MNDIQILQEMLNPNLQVMLQPEQGRPSVELTDTQSGATVKIKGVPPNSIIIRAEDFENPLTVFNGSKGERKRTDFVIISNDERGRKWINRPDLFLKISQSPIIYFRNLINLVP